MGTPAARFLEQEPSFFDAVGAWWVFYGGRLVVVLAVACAITAIAAITARRIVRPSNGERPRRGLARDACSAAVALLLLGLGFAAGGVVSGGRISGFFPWFAISFHALGIGIPAVALAGAARRRQAARAALAAPPLLLAIAMLTVEPNRLDVHRETIPVSKLPAGASIRVAHVTDLQTVGMSARDWRASAAVAAFDPDLVLFTGDLVHGPPLPGIAPSVRSWLGGLAARHGCFVVDGDSDADFAALVLGIPGVTYLLDRAVDLEIRGAKLRIAGTGNRTRPRRPDLLLADAPTDSTTILLAHNPQVFIQPPEEWHADLGFAGHTHGGQVQLPFVGALLTLSRVGRRYSDGVFRELRPTPALPWHVDTLVVCAGLGMEGGWAPRIRLLRPPQVMLLTLVGPER